MTTAVKGFVSGRTLKRKTLRPTTPTQSSNVICNRGTAPDTRPVRPATGSVKTPALSDPPQDQLRHPPCQLRQPSAGSVKTPTLSDPTAVWMQTGMKVQTDLYGLRMHSTRQCQCFQRGLFFHKNIVSLQVRQLNEINMHCTRGPYA